MALRIAARTMRSNLRHSQNPPVPIVVCRENGTTASIAMRRPKGLKRPAARSAGRNACCYPSAASRNLAPVPEHARHRRSRAPRLDRLHPEELAHLESGLRIGFAISKAQAGRKVLDLASRGGIHIERGRELPSRCFAQKPVVPQMVVRVAHRAREQCANPKLAQVLFRTRAFLFYEFHEFEPPA